MKGQQPKETLNIDERSQLDLTNEAIQELNDKYAHKISRGEIQLRKKQQRSRPTADTVYDQLMKQKKMAQAEREKEELEKKLEYLNRSIQSIRGYDYAKATSVPTESDAGEKSRLDFQ